MTTPGIYLFMIDDICAFLAGRHDRSLICIIFDQYQNCSCSIVEVSELAVTTSVVDTGMSGGRQTVKH